jgi:hypothetical protein
MSKSRATAPAAAPAADLAPAGLDLASIEAAPIRPPALEVCIVVAAAAALTVDSPSRGAIAATRAKSCLVAPDAGDRVLCALDGGRVFVLAVLEGAAASTRVVTDGDLAIESGGELALTAGSGATGLLRFAARELRVRAKVAAIAADELGFVGRTVEAQLEKLAVVAAQIESRADRLLQRAKQAFRFVEGLEQVRAGVVDIRAESLAALRGQNTVVAARALAKLDGEQVKIG